MKVSFLKEMIHLNCLLAHYKKKKKKRVMKWHNDKSVKLAEIQQPPRQF